MGSRPTARYFNRGSSFGSRQDRRVTGLVAPRSVGWRPTSLVIRRMPTPRPSLRLKPNHLPLRVRGLPLEPRKQNAATIGIRDLYQSLNAISVGIGRAVKVRATARHLSSREGCWPVGPPTSPEKIRSPPLFFLPLCARIGGARWSLDGACPDSASRGSPPLLLRRD